MLHKIQIEKNVRSGYPCKVNIDGVLYPSISSVLKEYGISPVSITTLKKRGMSQEEALSYAIDHAEELNNERQERKAKAEANKKQRVLDREKKKEREKQEQFTFQGKIYKTFRRAVENLSWEHDIFMNPASIKSSAKKHNRPLKEQLQITFDKHLARKNKETAKNIKEHGAFHNKMMGEIYHEALQMVIAEGLSGLTDDKAVRVIADNAGVSIENAEKLVKEFIEHERFYDHFDYANREQIRADNKYRLYSDVYKRWDWDIDAETDGTEENVMRKELKIIEQRLLENGWALSVPVKADEMAEYVKTYDTDNVIGIEIALDACSLGCYGYYGIGSVQLVKYENNMPYIRDDFRRMQELVYKAEKDLVSAGIPFRPDYSFGECTEYQLGKNLEAREKLNLWQYEKEDWKIR